MVATFAICSLLVTLPRGAVTWRHQAPSSVLVTRLIITAYVSVSMFVIKPSWTMESRKSKSTFNIKRLFGSKNLWYTVIKCQEHKKLGSLVITKHNFWRHKMHWIIVDAYSITQENYQTHLLTTEFDELKVIRKITGEWGKLIYPSRGLTPLV